MLGEWRILLLMLVALTSAQSLCVEHREHAGDVRSIVRVTAAAWLLVAS